ncbi:MAG: glycosyltransferase family 39 protein, partial [Phycisphaerales bacterium]|nr:glycosyltransferase family 39 protein [Phycisphaerales bacterium]
MKADKSPINGVRILLMGLAIIAIDLAIFYIFFGQDNPANVSHLVGFLSAAVVQYFLIYLWVPRGINFRKIIDWSIEFIIITLLMMFLQGGILSSLTQISNISLKWAILVCVVISSALYFSSSVGALYLRFYDTKSVYKKHYYWIWVTLYLIILRFSYLAAPELFYEEAYYWNYAMHLDIGYLDHPPLVAWIIAFFIKLMGDNEFAVRFGAFICWFITALFLYKLNSLVCSNNKSKTIQVVLLAAALPAYFATGWAMTPDAPLVACWAMALYFFYKALIKESQVAWVGVGLAVGLGMLAKYTIALLGISAIVFLLIDRNSRKWFIRPQPYIAIAIALAIFSPVLIWNFNHDWISFLYQSRGRVGDHSEFSLPYLIGTMILIITPTGILSLVAILLYKKLLFTDDNGVCIYSADIQKQRGYLLLMILSLFPVMVFVFISLFRETKFHWTAPCWLGIVPYMALIVAGGSQFGSHKFLDWVHRIWPATIIICSLLYGAFLYHFGLGFPEISYPYNYHLLGWNDFGREIELLVNHLEHQMGEKILVIGMDRNRIASGLAFYRTKAGLSFDKGTKQDPAFQTSSWHLFGGNGLMYEYWFPVDQQK